MDAQDQAIRILAQTLDEMTKAIAPSPRTTSPPQTSLNPSDIAQNPLLAGLPLIANILGGGGEIIPAEMQKQIVAQILANALNPPDRFSDFLKGFNMAIRTLTILTKGGKTAKKLEKMFPIEEEEK
ncbi:MAG: hypothetical protein QXG39_09820 [Candidatus Aenigmatarchaeota archaeon]